MCTTNFTTTQLQERRKIARIYVLDSINYNISIQHYRFSILISPNSFDLFSIVPFQFFYRPNVLFFHHTYSKNWEWDPQKFNECTHGVGPAIT